MRKYYSMFLSLICVIVLFNGCSKQSASIDGSTSPFKETKDIESPIHIIFDRPTVFPHHMVYDPQMDTAYANETRDMSFYENEMLFTMQLAYDGSYTDHIQSIVFKESLLQNALGTLKINPKSIEKASGKLHLTRKKHSFDSFEAVLAQTTYLHEDFDIRSIDIGYTADKKVTSIEVAYTDAEHTTVQMYRERYRYETARRNFSQEFKNEKDLYETKAVSKDSNDSLEGIENTPEYVRNQTLIGEVHLNGTIEELGELYFPVDTLSYHTPIVTKEELEKNILTQMDMYSGKEGMHRRGSLKESQESVFQAMDVFLNQKYKDVDRVHSIEIIKKEANVYICISYSTVKYEEGILIFQYAPQYTT